MTLVHKELLAHQESHKTTGQITRTECELPRKHTLRKPHSHLKGRHTINSQLWGLEAGPQMDLLLCMCRQHKLIQPVCGQLIIIHYNGQTHSTYILTYRNRVQVLVPHRPTHPGTSSGCPKRWQVQEIFTAVHMPQWFPACSHDLKWHLYASLHFSWLQMVLCTICECLGTWVLRMCNFS